MSHIYKLLIADDEYWIREQLRILIDWKSYSIEFLEPACDGEEVLERAELEHPDIIITDINMPFVNGIELIRKLKNFHPEIQTIIISGYNDFEYVKEGLLLGALDYILKPISKMDLVGAVTKALDIINERRMTIEKEKYQRSQLLRATSAMTDRELSELIVRQNVNLPGSETGRQTLYHTAGAANTGYYLLLARIHNINAMADIFHNDINLLSYSIKQQLKEKLKSRIILLFNNVYSTGEFILILDVRPEELSELAYTVLLALKEFTGKVITIGVGERHYGDSEFQKAYEEAKYAVTSRSLSEASRVIRYEDLKNKKSREARFHGKQEEQLIRMLKENMRGCKKYLMQTAGLENCIQNEWTIREIKNTLKRISMILDTHIQKEPEEMSELQSLADFMIHAVEDNNVVALPGIINDYLDTALKEEMETTGYTSGKETIKAITEYIEQYFYEEITLGMLADKYHIESSYLSKLFKRETGYNLTFFISMKRIDKAKEMIGKNESSLTEISFFVGYDDYNYFNKVFRKIAGVSPREYRSNFTGNILTETAK
ncbi:MAG: response regulator [Lachnospiraceae bacterium]|nr:response regulator [Lachnospiraceae bacterium]